LILSALYTLEISGSFGCGKGRRGSRCTPKMPEEKKPEDGIGGAKDIYLVTTVGLQIVISVLIGFGMGLWIDRWLGTKPWFMLLFILLGLVAGFLNVYRVVIQSGVSNLDGLTKDEITSGKGPEDWDDEDS